MSDKPCKSWLTSKLARRNTAHRGLYAVQPLAKDERIWFLCDPVLRDPMASQLVYAYLSLPELGGESFTHSCAPNAGFRGAVELVAMQPISPGEQITFDYAMCLPFGQMTCRCGAPTCRKVVTGNDWELPALQQRYQGYFQTFIEEKIAQVKKCGKSQALL